MSTLSKFLVGMIGFALVVGAVSTGLATIVTYKPFGVSDFERARYESRVEEILRHEAIRKASGTQAVPQVVVPRRRYDFGLLDPNETASHSFEFQNSGTAPLALNVAETTCKCTVGKIESGLLLPGERTQVTLTWNTGRQEEHYEQKALVTTNDPTRQSIELTVEGTVRTNLHVPETCRFAVGDPGECVESTFVVHSQLHDVVTLLSVESELNGMEWSSESVSPDETAELAGREARGATRITLKWTGSVAGPYHAKVALQLLVGEQLELIEKETLASGRTHEVLSFHSPMLHSKEGLDIGTLSNSREHVFQVLVRQRAKKTSTLAVLDFKPKLLKPSVQRINEDGDYRLTIRIPEGANASVFNLNQKHGYIEVGDPVDPEVSNWFPILGAVVATDE